MIYSLTFSLFGLWLNLRMPRLDWQNEAEVIKQGGATMICVFTGMGAGFAPAILAGLTGSSLVSPVVAALALVAALILWRSLLQSGERRLLLLH
ncbi:MAG: hypothetical protein R2881_07305 [Eubacteriales bacterium]